MATPEKDALLSLLFEKEGDILKNIKFFRGDKDVITQAEFCGQVQAGLMQAASGSAKRVNGFDSHLPKVDVKSLISDSSV